jgi:hypothetical protein
MNDAPMKDDSIFGKNRSFLGYRIIGHRTIGHPNPKKESVK